MLKTTAIRYQKWKNERQK